MLEVLQQINLTKRKLKLRLKLKIPKELKIHQMKPKDFSLKLMQLFILIKSFLKRKKLQKLKLTRNLKQLHKLNRNHKKLLKLNKNLSLFHHNKVLLKKLL
jgi:hypothetical protein